MKRNTLNILLVIGAVVPLVILFWPFAQYGTFAGVALRFVTAFCLQLLLCRVTEHRLLMAMPIGAAAVIALWGGYLFITSESWINATFGGYIADYVTMFIGCIVAVVTEKTKS